MRRAKFRSLDACKQILALLKANGFVNVDITGGEPTLHSGIIEIVRHAHQDLGLKGRLITLGQYLMRRMPNCQRDRLIDDLLEAGLTNVLFSMHAVDEGLFEELTGESWRTQRQAMEYLDQRGFHYTTNTVVTEWNYRHLPDVAREVIKHRIYLCNFILMNAYYAWSQAGRGVGVQAKYSAIAPYLKETVDYLEAHDVAVNIRYAPLCTMRGMEKNLVGVVGVRYDPYEWMNAGGHQGGEPEHCAARIPVSDGGLEPAFQYWDCVQMLENGLRIIGVRGQNLKQFPDVCNTCRARPICDGVDPNYLKHYGTSEFVPYTEPQGTLLHHDRLRYHMAFLVKTEPDADMQAVVRQAFVEWRAAGQRSGAAKVSASHREPIGAQAQPWLSVIIPTRNRRRILEKTLRAYASQTLPAEPFEVIVVDDGSDDDSLAALETMQVPFPLRVLRQPHQGANAARNRGIAAAAGEIVLLTGDDMIPAPGFLQGHAAFHRDHPDEQDAMLGGIEWSPEIEITPFMRYIVSPAGGQQFSLHLARDGRADFRLFYTCNVSVKRRLLLSQQPVFDPAFHYPAYDDVELGYRLEKAGMRLHYRPEIVAYHNHPLTLDEFACKMRQAGAMAVVLARKHPELERVVLRPTDLCGPPVHEREELAASLRLTLAELEKVDCGALARGTLNGRSFDSLYTKGVLYPAYGAFLDAIYALGVADALSAAPAKEDARYAPSPAVHATATAAPSRGYGGSSVLPEASSARSEASGALVSRASSADRAPQRCRPPVSGASLPRGPKPFGINLVGYVSGNLGLGVFARHVVRQLLDQGIPVTVADADPGQGRTKADLTYGHLFAQRWEDCRHPLTLFVLGGDAVAALPPHVIEMLAARGWLAAMPFWELPAVPPTWRDPYQRMDALVAPSDFIRSTLENTFSDMPIVRALVPLRLPHAVTPNRRKFGLSETAFVVLTCFEPHSDPIRKNPRGAIDAFRLAWPNDPRVRLVIKVNNAGSGGESHPAMEWLRQEACQDLRVLLIDRVLSYDEMLELMASSDVFVSLHRAEGFGLPLFEAMALGKPVVATAWSGNMSFMTYDTACLIGYQLQPVRGTLPVYQQAYVGRDCCWADPSIPEAAAWLDRLRRDTETRAAIGERAKKRVQEYNAVAASGRWIEELAAIVRAREQGLGRRSAQLASLGNRSERTFACSIIVPVHNHVELTRQCLEALAASTQGLEYEVIIVDNGSTDETPALLASLGGHVQVIRNDQHLGFAKACNQGARTARGRYLVFLNTNTIPQPGWLEALVREVEEHAGVAVVGGKLLCPDGTVQHAGVAFNRAAGIPYRLYRGFPADAPAVNRRRELQAVTATGMLVRREVYEEVGGFDEAYRNGSEDVDLCLKIRERGWTIVYQPTSVLTHLGCQSPGPPPHEPEDGRLLRDRWGQRWRLADEDLLAYEDGFRCDHSSPGSVRWLPFAGDQEREAWGIVAETQRAAQHYDDDTVRRRIRNPERWPADAGALRWGAQLAHELGDYHVAAAFWRRVLALSEDADGRIALAKAELAAGRREEAETQLACLPDSLQGSGEAWLLRGILALQRQDWAQAERAFETALAHGADRRKAELGLGMAAFGRGDAERAWQIVSAVVAEYPDDEDALHWLLRAGTVLARWNELEQLFHRFVERNPAELAFRYAWAGVLLRCGRWDEAHAQASTIRLLQPEFPGLAELEQAVRDATATQAQPVA